MKRDKRDAIEAQRDAVELAAIEAELERRREGVLCIVVVTDEGTPLDSLLPATPMIARGAGKMYRVYRADTWRDYCNVDGTPLATCCRFETVQDARAWVERDIALRNARTDGVQ